MSMTKRSEAYNRHFTELNSPDNSYQEYLEWCYLNGTYKSKRNTTQTPNNQSNERPENDKQAK